MNIYPVDERDAGEEVTADGDRVMIIRPGRPDSPGTRRAAIQQSGALYGAR